MFKRLYSKTEGLLTYTDYKKASGKVIYIVFMAVLCILVVLCVLPVIWLFLSSFKTPSEFYAQKFTFFPKSMDLRKIYDVFKYVDLGKYFLNSVIVIAGATACSLLINGLMAFSISMVKPKGYKLVYVMIMASMMIPSITSIVPLFDMLVKLKLINSLVPLCLVFGANAYYFVMIKTYFDSITRSVIEAAAIDGANKLDVFFRVVLPLSLPIFGVVAIFTVNAAWSDFLMPYVVLQKDAVRTLMVKIYTIQSTMGTSSGFGVDKLLMVLVISILPPLALFAAFQKLIVGSVSTSGMKD